MKSWNKDLPKSKAYNAASVCIEFLGGKNKDELCRQIVPPEFVAGSFHLMLTLGPQAAWEKGSALLTVMAVGLGITELVIFSAGDNTNLTSCADVDNVEKCIYVGSFKNDPNHMLYYRRSMGFWLANVSVMLSAVALILLRFAATKKPSVGEAIGEIFCRLPADVFTVVCSSFRRLCSTMWADLCPSRQHADEGHVPLLSVRADSKESSRMF